MPGGYPPPSASVLDIAVDDRGLLWVVGEAPDERWETAVGPKGKPLNSDSFIDSIIEVIEPDTGRLLARRRLDGSIRGFVAPGLAFAVRNTDAGLPRIDLIEVRLERR